MGFVKLAKATSAAGVVLLIFDVATLFLPSRKEELYAIFPMCKEMEYRYGNNKYVFMVYLLFGSHSNEIKIEVYQKKKYWSFSNCYCYLKESKEFVSAAIFSFRWNGIYNDLRNILTGMNYYPTKREVKWKYTYF